MHYVLHVQEKTGGKEKFNSFLKSQYIFAKLEPSKLILKNYPSPFKSVLLPLPPTGRTIDPYLQSL